MIRIERSGGGVALSSRLDPGGVAFLDREWIAARPGAEAPALVASPSGSLRFTHGDDAEVSTGVEPETAALVALLALADAAVAALGDAPARPIEVLGGGLVAHLARRRLAARTDGTPAAIVDTTGDPALIEVATRRLADGGLLALAGEPQGRPLDLNVYTDVHSRGLRLAGVRRPLATRVAPREPDLSGAPPPARVIAGQPLRDALWYRLDA